MNLTKRVSPNRNTRRSGWRPDIIVNHITDGAYFGAVEWLCNPKSGVSAHFVVAKDGRITQLVELTDTAWANGTKTDASDNRYFGFSKVDAVRARKVNANSYTISIEYEGFSKDGQGVLPEAQLAAGVELVQHIRAEVKRLFGVDIPADRQHIVGHCDIVPKWKPNCPGAKFPYDEIIRRVNGGATQQTPEAPTLRRGDKGTAVADMQALLNAAINAKLTVDGSFGAATEAAVKVFQAAQGLVDDGVCGIKTIVVLLAACTPATDPKPEPATRADEIIAEMLARKINFDEKIWRGVTGSIIQTNPDHLSILIARAIESRKSKPFTADEVVALLGMALGV